MTKAENVNLEAMLQAIKSLDTWGKKDDRPGQIIEENGIAYLYDADGVALGVMPVSAAEALRKDKDWRAR